MLVYKLLCEPSQYGPLDVLLQLHKNIVLSTSLCTIKGLNPVPL